MSHTDNLFPSPENYPYPSFTQGVTPPDIDPDEGETILVAYNPAWSPVLAAAVNQLLQYATWEGSHDEKVLAVERAANLKMFLMIPVTVPERDYPTPYWDSDEEVDDEAPAETQDWYGLVTNQNAPANELTFIENAVIWLLTGFVAIAASPTLAGSVAAAVTFRTLAKRFVLAFKRGDLREQFRVIIDAKDYAEVDTESFAPGDVIELVVNDLPDGANHDIMIVSKNIP